MHTIECKVHLEFIDDLTPDQIDQVRDGTGCGPLNDETIEKILDGFRLRLREQKEKHNGMVVFAWDS